MNFSTDWTRRSFIQASLLTLFTLAGGPNAWASLVSDREQLSAPLSLFNIHTGERLTTAYREDCGGDCNQEALAQINHLLRCHYTDEVHPIDVRTLDYLAMINQQLGGGNEIHIVSGYRSPTYNDKLRNEGHGVAKNSLHLQGKAIDLRIPGIKLSTLRRMALSLRFGGVGFYPRTDFIHLDSGRFRMW